MYGYAVFGQVADGMDVIYEIERVATGATAGYENVPLEPVVITKVTVIE
jgi:peptidyl-prolyl cis-trans isomerase B (cyclophilin B)